MHDPADFGPFFDFVEANYVAVDTIWPFTFYALRLRDSEVQPPPKGELIIRSTYAVYLDGRTLTYVKDPCAPRDDAAKRFILHVIPFDKSVIGGNEHAQLGLHLCGRLEDWKVGEVLHRVPPSAT